MEAHPDTTKDSVAAQTENAFVSAASSITQEVTDPENQTCNTEKTKFQTGKSRIDSKIIYDAILGLSDGLTVPFALTAGLASVGSTRIVILGGLAELIAGAISMGLGGFVGSKSEVETYQTAERRCEDIIVQRPQTAHGIIDAYFSEYHLPEQEKQSLVQAVMSSHDTMKAFLMQHHFSLEKPDTGRPYISALTLALSYFLGGFLALIPYLCVRKDQVYLGLYWSIGIMGVVMLIFGYVKTCVVRGWRGRSNILAGIQGAVQMLVIGALAVGAAVGLVRAIQHGSSI